LISLTIKRKESIKVLLRTLKKVFNFCDKKVIKIEKIKICKNVK